MDSNEHAEPLNGKSDKDQPATAQTQSEDTVTNRRIAKNATLLTVALLVQKILTFGYFIYINKSINPEPLGSYFIALNISTIFGYFVDIAFSQVLIREIAKRKERTSQYLNAALSLKMLVAIFIYAAVVLYVIVQGYNELTRSLVYLTGIIMVLDSFTLTFYSVFRGHQQLHYEAIGTVINVIIKIAIGVVGIKLGIGVIGIVMAILVASVFNFLYSGILLLRRLHWKPSFRWDGDTLLFLAKIVIPFAIAGVFVTIYTNQDQFLLGNPHLVGAKGPSYLAWYGTAYKYAFALSFIPAAVAAAIFPAFSEYYVSNKQMLAKTFERAFGYLMSVGVPITLGIIVLAKQIILTAASKAFVASIIPLQLLSISLFFLFLNYPVGYLLNATDRQTRNTLHIGIVTVINLVLNTILIPQRAFIGAAIASVISSIILVGLGLFVVPQIIEVRTRAIVMLFAKAMVAGGSMAVLLFVLEPSMKLMYLLPLGASWYTLVMFVLRGFSLDDGKKVFHILRQKAG